MFTINATVRHVHGKGASRRLRHANKLPAIVYGGTKEPVSIELSHDFIATIQDKNEFYSEILALVIDGEEEKVKVQAMQRHPYKPKVTHIDFIRT